MSKTSKVKAPYGIRADGKPKRKPGRKTNAERKRRAAREAAKANK